MSHYLPPAEIREGFRQLDIERAALQAELTVVRQKGEILRLRCRHTDIGNRADYSGDKWRECNICGEINPVAVPE